MFCFLYIRYLGVPYEFCAADHEIDIEFSYNVHFIKLPFLDNPSHCWSTCILSTKYAVLCSPGMPGQCDVFEVLSYFSYSSKTCVACTEFCPGRLISDGQTGSQISADDGLGYPGRILLTF